MKSATRLIPSLSQPIRSSVRSRLPLCRIAVAGPSSVHRYASTSIPPQSSVASSTSGQVLDAGRSSGEAVSEVEEIPSNVSFEEIEAEADEQVERGLGYSDANDSPLFSTSGLGGRFEPVLLPISSLASTTPTLPSESNLAVSLPPDIFAQPIRRDILHRCVIWYLSTLRSGTKTTKTRSTVHYSGRKLQPQKGTGKARVGDASSGTRRGGAPIHPIKPKNWAQLLPRKVRELGLKIALSSKLSSGLMRVVQDLNEGQWTGTNDARRALCNQVQVVEKEVDLEPILSASSSTSGAEGEQSSSVSQSENQKDKQLEYQVINRFGRPENLSVLFLYSPNKHYDELINFHRVTRNIPGIEIMSTEEVQVYHILKYKWLVMEGGAVDAFSGIEAWEQEIEAEAEEGGEWLSEVEENVSGGAEQKVVA